MHHDPIKGREKLIKILLDSGGVPPDLLQLPSTLAICKLGVREIEG